MQSNKRIMEMSTDAFDVLPDDLLIDILSFLGVKGAGITSVLSKRWECLWAELPRLEFELNDMDPLNYVSWVNRTIDVRKANYLEKFKVEFDYNESFASDVDAWVEFCVKNKVKQLILMLNLSGDAEYYTPPQVMYSCSSLTTLCLEGCVMAYEGTIEWQSLTDLTLEDVELNQHLLDEILSSCPILKNLEITSCRGFNRLEVNSRHLKSLEIMEDYPMTDEEFLEISAPYIRSLDIGVLANRRKSLKLVNISSVVTASIDVHDDVYDDDDGSVEIMDKVKDLLENFKHVNRLHIRRRAFKILSNMAVNGWQIPQFRVQHLIIDPCNESQLSISGITCLIESSPNLETLSINVFGMEEEILDPNGELVLALASILRRRALALE